MLRTLDLGVLNSATKYPPIPTCHRLDPSNGMLLPEPVEFAGQVIATEKVDGTNGRIVQAVHRPPCRRAPPVRRGRDPRGDSHLEQGEAADLA